jgi:PQQ-dependent catabolism-associated CXXCW motif protein
MRFVVVALCGLLIAGTSAPASAEPIPPRMLLRLQHTVLAQPAYANEDYDDGLPPAQTLRTAAFEGPTPTTVPGAKTIATPALRDLIVSRQPPVLLDVLDAPPRSLPGAVLLSGAGRGTSFTDDIQTRLAKKLPALTAGRSTTPIVVFCQGPSCWLAYNVALRLLKLGATVLWYRGGHQAWQEAGLPQLPVTPEAW